MEEMIIGGEYYHEQIEKMMAPDEGYRKYHGQKGVIGEGFLIVYSNLKPEWVLSFMLVNVGVVNRHDLYRLIYKYIR